VHHANDRFTEKFLSGALFKAEIVLSHLGLDEIVLQKSQSIEKVFNISVSYIEQVLVELVRGCEARVEPESATACRLAKLLSLRVDK
jgi:hypothetical protein